MWSGARWDLDTKNPPAAQVLSGRVERRAGNRHMLKRLMNTMTSKLSAANIPES